VHYLSNGKNKIQEYSKIYDDAIYCKTGLKTNTKKNVFFFLEQYIQ